MSESRQFDPARDDATAAFQELINRQATNGPWPAEAYVDGKFNVDAFVKWHFGECQRLVDYG